MPKFKRRQLFVDPKVQGALVLRLLGYWLVTMVTAVAIVIGWRIVTGTPRFLVTHFSEMVFYYGPAVVAALLLLPLIIVDCVRTSNRFAGPLYRLRRCMRDLGKGLPVPPIHFRDGDFWIELADEFNLLSARMQQMQQELADLKGTSLDSFGELAEPAATAKR
jgi:hypothetical protein